MVDLCPDGIICRRCHLLSSGGRRKLQNCLKENDFCRNLRAEKSTLWTDAGVDQNFQRDLEAIGPYKFQGNVVWISGPLALCSGKFVWTNGTEIRMDQWR